MSLLELRNLCVQIRRPGGWNHILRDVSLSLEPGQVCGLVGQSGAGKSMIARSILGMLPRSAKVAGGEILFDGTPLLSVGIKALRGLLGREIALIPQDPMVSLNPVRTIGDQVNDGLRLHLGLSTADARRAGLQALADVLIRDPERVYDNHPHVLSGGMRQRILIAMAFSARPRLIIADEPTTALDVTVQKRVLSLIRSLQRKHNTAIVFVTHDLGVVAKICDRVAVMYQGRIIENSVASSLFDKPAHDYTRALLEATPRYDVADKALSPVPPSILEQLDKETEEHDRTHDN